MNEIDYRKWLQSKGYKVKIISDLVSRLKKIEREINNCDIDEQYRSDKCEYLLSLFERRGDNDRMKKYIPLGLPIGKKHISTYTHAIYKYIEFCKDVY